MSCGGWSVLKTPKNRAIVAASNAGGSGSVVEADETYFGNTKHPKISKQRKGRPYSKAGPRGPANKRAIISLVERGGSVRSFHVQNADKPTVVQIVSANVERETRLHTDESRLYSDAAQIVQQHETVNHFRGEYVRGETHTNTVEGYFSIFKRGMKGIYQHCSEKHLQRYLSEFDFRYSNRVLLGVNDLARTNLAVQGIVGKRLTYRTIN